MKNTKRKELTVKLGGKKVTLKIMKIARKKIVSALIRAAEKLARMQRKIKKEPKQKDNRPSYKYETRI